MWWTVTVPLDHSIGLLLDINILKKMKTHILKNTALALLSVSIVTSVVYWTLGGWEGVENAADGDSLTHTVWNSLVDGVVKKTGNIAETITGNKTFSWDTTLGGKVNTTPNTTSITSGSITYAGLNTYVNWEGNIDDNLDTISWGTAGDIIILTMNGNGIITLRDDSIGGGNIALIRNGTRVLEWWTDSITLKYTWTFWTEVSTNIENEFKNLKATNGYTYLPNWLIMQWGRDTVAAGGGGTSITLPVTFPNAALNSTSHHYWVVPSIGTAATYTTSQIRLYHTHGSAVSVQWQIIGY